MRCHLVGCGTPDRMRSVSATGSFYSSSHEAVIRVYDEAGNVIATHEHKSDFKEP
jgi:hypothetical protein